MFSYFDTESYKEAQNSLNTIISYYDYNSNHMNDLDIYQAIIYSFSGNIQKVFKIFKKVY